MGDLTEAEATADHAVHHRLHHGDRRQHIGVQGADPILALPIPEIAGRRPAGIIDEDIRIGTGGQRRRASGFGGDIAGRLMDGDPGLGRDLRRRPRQNRLIAAGDGDDHTLPRQSHGTCAPQAFARRANNGPPPCNSEIHDASFSYRPTNGIGAGTRVGTRRLSTVPGPIQMTAGEAGHGHTQQCHARLITGGGRKAGL
jgi:hypothetical protein